MTDAWLFLRRSDRSGVLSGMFVPRLFALWVACASLSAVVAACALGEPEEPGCQSDVECGAGLVCRAGACFRLVGEPGSPELDAGLDAGDAG